MAAHEPQPELYMDVVRRVARALRRSLPAEISDLEELEADGFEALVRVVQEYDASRGPLIPYIVLRCRGAMLDGLRRRMRGRRPAPQENGERPLVLSLEATAGDGLPIEEMVADPHAETADDVIERVSCLSAKPQLDALPRRSRRVAFLRFVLNRSQADVAAAEGVSPQTIAKIEGQIRRGLDESVEAEDECLTAKELRVLRLAAEGASSHETAKHMQRAYETVKDQRRTIIAKLRARNIVNAVAIGYERGLLQ